MSSSLPPWLAFTLACQRNEARTIVLQCEPLQRCSAWLWRPAPPFRRRASLGTQRLGSRSTAAATLRASPTGSPIRRAVGGSPWMIRYVSPRSRSEEPTSELQSQFHLVCRLRLEKQRI